MTAGAELRPHRQPGVFAFVRLSAAVGLGDLDDCDVVATMREPEGLTLVLPEPAALRRGYRITFRCAWITLRLVSALDAVGLTASFANALAARGIACNVIAGSEHDHLFVPIDRADEAVRVLAALRWSP